VVEDANARHSAAPHVVPWPPPRQRAKEIRILVPGSEKVNREGEPNGASLSAPRFGLIVNFPHFGAGIRGTKLRQISAITERFQNPEEDDGTRDQTHVRQGSQPEQVE
jgi:hypothetical protein